MDEPGTYIEVSWDKFVKKGSSCNFDYLSEGDELKGQLWNRDEFYDEDGEMCGFILYLKAEECGNDCPEEDRTVKLYTYRENGFDGSHRLGLGTVTLFVTLLCLVFMQA